MKKVLIICNGKPPSKQLFNNYRANADYLIAADGGGNIALDFGVSPDVVIGDMDSFNREKEKQDGIEFIFQPDQETNDLEKALWHARKEKATHVHVLGATGLRLDHTLKNLSVLKQFDSHFKEMRFRDTFGEIRLIEKKFSEKFPVGTQISLFPLSGIVTGISTIGLKYPLNNESLENGVRDGSSNVVTDNQVQITHKKGDLLLFVADLQE